MKLNYQMVAKPLNRQLGLSRQKHYLSRNFSIVHLPEQTFYFSLPRRLIHPLDKTYRLRWCNFLSFKAIVAFCVLIALNIFQLKRKNPREKITFPFVIALILGLLIILGLRILIHGAG